MKKNEEQRIKYFREIIREGRKKKTQFLGKTFSTKFFLKYCSDLVQPSFVCFQILSYEPENRNKDDIDKASPWLKNLKYFYNFISLKETEDNTQSLIKKLTWVINRKVFQKNIIIKRAGERDKYFYIILEGNIIKLDLIKYRQVLSIEEYLLYLIKMKLIDEKEILKKCRIFNKSIVELKDNNIKSFCIENNIYNYEMLKKKAIKELNEVGLIINPNIREDVLGEEDIKFKNLDNYLKLFFIEINPKRQHEQTKAYFTFYLFKYEISRRLNDGFFFGTFLKEELKENSTYISENRCNIGIINKEFYYNEDIYEAILNKKKKIFQEIKQNFFIFHHIKEDLFCNNYAQFMVYKKFYRGEKIFFQNACYEGIFLVQSGEIRISIDISIDDMYNLISYLTYALNGFIDYVSGFNTKDFINEQKNQQDKRIKSHNTLDQETAKLYLELNKYNLMTIKENNILGTNETYDHQTEIYNFSAECISDEVILYFLPKEILNIILNREKMVYNSVIQLVEFRIKNIIWKIKNYIQIFETKIEKIKVKKKKIKEKKIYSNHNIKNNYNTDFNLKDNSPNNFSNIKKRNNLLYSFSKANISKENKYKKFFLTQENKNDIIYTLRNSRNSLPINSMPKIPLLYTKEKIEDNDFKYNNKYSFSKNKNNIKNTFPKKFPYLVVDSYTKRNFSKDNHKNNFFEKIKTSKNIKPIKIKNLYIDNYFNNKQ